MSDAKQLPFLKPRTSTTAGADGPLTRHGGGHRGTKNEQRTSSAVLSEEIDEGGRRRLSVQVGSASCGPFWVTGKMAVVEDWMELVGLDIRSFPRPKSAPQPVAPGGTLRRIPLAAIVGGAARRFVQRTGEGGVADPVEDGASPWSQGRREIRGRRLEKKSPACTTQAITRARESRTCPVRGRRPGGRGLAGQEDDLSGPTQGPTAGDAGTRARQPPDEERSDGTRQEARDRPLASAIPQP